MKHFNPSIGTVEKLFSGNEWGYDGHGINASGVRVATMSRELPPGHDDAPQLYFQHNVGQALADFAAVAHKLQVVTHEKYPPQIFLKLKESEIEDRPDTILTLTVQRENGTKAMFAVSIVNHHGRIKCQLRAVKKDGLGDDNDSVVERTGQFIDWS